jgi:structural maintenance of chromosome 3 (chondroitin sulfate proteoglycan 6)
LSITRQGAQSELTDLVRARTELECIVQDLRNAGAQTGGKRVEYEKELTLIEEEIVNKEAILQEVTPAWESQRTREVAERRKLDEASARLAALYAKQGRVNRFRTKAERDTFLRHEIASIDAYRASQTNALEATRAELVAAREKLVEVDGHIAVVADKMEDGKTRVRELGDQISALRDEQSELVEKRKELWREDTKLDSQLSHASDQLGMAERALATMIDKVSFLFIS